LVAHFPITCKFVLRLRSRDLFYNPFSVSLLLYLPFFFCSTIGQFSHFLDLFPIRIKDLYLCSYEFILLAGVFTLFCLFLYFFFYLVLIEYAPLSLQRPLSALLKKLFIAFNILPILLLEFIVFFCYSCLLFVCFFFLVKCVLENTLG